MSPAPTAQFARLFAADHVAASCTLDGLPFPAAAGDTVLTALLAHRRDVRAFDFSADRRAGFCLMGACQDCWVALESGERIRACTTPIEPGMRLISAASEECTP